MAFGDEWATEWSYFVPYEENIFAALQHLRDEVFANGEYATSDSEILSGNRLFLLSDPEKTKPKPKTIEELIEQEGASGTHSILDIFFVSPIPKRRGVSPLPKEVLLDYFSSDKPSPEEVDEVYEYGSLEKYVSKPWRGIYIVAYKDDEPFQIFFAGCSGA
jgi:hypothetical protein